MSSEPQVNNSPRTASFVVTAGRISRLGLVNFWRNRWLTLSATLLMTLTLLTVGVSLILTYIVRDTATQIRAKIDLTLYFEDDNVPDTKLTDLASRIQQQQGVESVRVIDKDEASRIFKRLPIQNSLKDPISKDFNPLPRSVQIDVQNPDTINSLVSTIRTIDTDKIVCDNCFSVLQNQDTVNRLLQSTKAYQRAGIVLSIFFGLVAIFNVFNIIRLTILARSDEIEIMRYVGASNSFVRGPFIVEGLLYGVGGTLLATIMLLFFAKLIEPYFLSTSSYLNMGFYEYITGHLGIVVLAQLSIGLLLGIVVSLLSIRRYLKA